MQMQENVGYDLGDEPPYLNRCGRRRRTEGRGALCREGEGIGVEMGRECGGREKGRIRRSWKMGNGVDDMRTVDF